MAIDFRYAQFSDYPRISTFLDQHWEKDYIYVRMPKLFDWTFGRADLWDQHGYSFALLEDKGEIVGILGAIPFTFNCLGQSFPAVWFANYMVHPEYRRGPLAMRLLGVFNRPPYRMKIVFGMNSRVVPIYRRMGWNTLEPIPRHFVILPNAIERACNLFRLAHPNWDSGHAEELARFFTLNDIPPISIPFARTFPPNWNACDWPKIASQTAGAARDLNYLTWRYLKHPCFEYRIAAVAEGERTGLVVWRLETIRHATPNGREGVDRIGRLVEFLPVSRNNAGDLLSVFLNELKDANALGADFYGYHGKSGAWLEELGFRRVEHHPNGENIPARLQPLDPRPSHILSAFFYHDQLPACSSDPQCVWYWTKSDADQDRPN